MHEFFAKIVRFAFSKGAAFIYAVAVGVSGNLAFNYLQPKDPAPAPSGVAASIPAAAQAAPSANQPAASHSVPTAGTGPVAAAPVEATKPAASRPVATAPIQPDPSASLLPSLATLPSPALKPAALPARELPKEFVREPAAPTLEGPAKGDSAAKPDQLLPGASNAAPLSPIGPAIDVSPVPAPPPRPAPPVSATAAIPPEQPGKRQPWEFSDIWHPVRAVEKAGDWAGDQLPLIGGTAADTHRAPMPTAKPISLLPPTAQAAEPKPAKAAAPANPGPGSGGLY